MSCSTLDTGPLARDVRVTSEVLEVTLTDGRRLSLPIMWFPRLEGASVEDRAAWELLGDGEGIRWPELDEDLTVAGLLAGRRASESK